MPDGKPDFSGIYTQPSTVNPTGPRGNLIFNADKMAPLKPGAESLLYEPRNGDPRHDEPRAMCLPCGFSVMECCTSCRFRSSRIRNTS